MRGKAGCTGGLSVFLRVMALIAASFIPALPIIHSSSQAQTPPITSSGLNTQISGPIAVGGKTQFDITGGTRPGGGTNLFHSFGNFNVPNSNIANFLNETALPTNNILGRVTGGNISNIFGTIQTTGFGNANLFLMNPAGFLFGPNATVNVGGMVAFTSADYLRLSELNGSNAGVFHADPAQASVLTSAPVAAFGFLGSNPGAITVQGSQLTVADGTGISLIGGNITIQSGTPEGGTPQPARLSAPNGTIQLASAASSGEFNAATLQPLPNVANASFTSFGSVTLAPGSTINVGGASTVSIRGGEFVLSVDNAVLTTAATPAQADSVILNNGSVITAETSGANPSGDITLNANAVQLNGGSLIRTSSDGGGAAGNINLTASQSLTLQGVDLSGNPSRILSDTNSSGNGGAINIQAPSGSVLLDGGVIQTSTNSDGLAGDINLNVRNLTARAGGQIVTSGSDAAPSGSITVTASDLIWFSGRSDPSNASSASGIFNVNNGFNGTGNISIQTKNLLMEQGARIRNDAFFDLSGTETPKISIGASNDVTLSGGSGIIVDTTFGDVGSLAISAHSISLSDVSVISTRTVGPGAGGQLSLTADTVSITGGSQVVSSTEQDAGRGGDVRIVATDRLSMSGQGVDENGSTISSGIFTFSSPFATGDAGNVSISARTVEISGGAQINSSTFGSGAAGSLTIEGTASPAQSILIDGAGSGLFTTTSGTGAGGNITIESHQVQLSNSGIISAKTTGAGNAGNILVKADSVSIENGAQLTSSSVIGDSGEIPTGNAGNVTIQGLASPAQSVLIDGGFVSTETQGSGAGGNITIDGNAVTLQNGATLSAKTSGSEATATGGTITVNAYQMNTDGATITVETTGAGQAGSIALITQPMAGLTADAINLNNSLITSSTSSNANAGDILMQTGTLRIENSQVSSDASPFEGFTGGNAGNIHAQVGGNITLTNAFITTSTGGNGNAGNILMASNSLQAESSFLGSTANASPGLTGGNGGTIQLTIGQTANLSNTNIDSQTAANGNAGNILVAAQTLALDNSTLSTGTSPGQGFTGGNAGNIQLTVGNLSMNDSLIVSQSLFSAGNGGTVTINASESITTSGTGIFPFAVSTSTDGAAPFCPGTCGSGGNISVMAPSMVLNGVGLNSTTTGQGNAGNILANVGTLTVMNGAQISASAKNPGVVTGTGGNVTIQGQAGPAQSVLIDGAGSGLSTDTDGTGAGGNIVVNANTVTLQNGGTLSATTSGTVPGATGGTITVTAPGQMAMTGGSSISASSSGPANAGDISINAGQQLTMQNSSITTEASQASGGNITIQAVELVGLETSKISASVLGGPQTTGGNITIDPNLVILQNSQITANAVQGNGGNISLTTNFLIVNNTLIGATTPVPASAISASSQFGENGTITIQSPNAPASGKIIPLSQKPLLATSLLNQRCASLAGGEFSSFTVAGRDSLPTEPGGWLASPLAFGSAGTGGGVLAGKGGRAEFANDPTRDTTILSLRQIAPPGFLTQAFAVDWSAGCQS